MTRQEVTEYVKKWMDGHEPDTFVRNEYGKALYTAKHSTLNIQIFFEELLADFIDDDEVVLRQPNASTSSPLDQLYECEVCKDFYEPDESGTCPHCGN